MFFQAALLLVLGTTAVSSLEQPTQTTTTAQVAATGTSPRPTHAPAELLGRMLVPRSDDYTMGANTCGFVSSDGASFTCLAESATCGQSSGYLGCCESSQSCSMIKTTCIDYQSASAGACDNLSDYNTLCCSNSAAPACYTWLLSPTGTNSHDGETLTMFECAAATGTGALLDHDPEQAGELTCASPTRARPTSGADDDDDSDDDESSASTPHGAIGYAMASVFIATAFVFAF